MPFFEFFRTLRLEPLETDDCRRLWEAVSGDEVKRRQIRPLQILTGGNPRLLVIAARRARHRSLPRLMEELVTLIDDHTEYFRSHLLGIAKIERLVYLAVIDLWRPSSTAEIAARCRQDVRIVSAMLGRLVKRGLVSIEGSGRKRRYAAAERLHGIYYKLRRQRDDAAVVRNLIRFMAAFYREPEAAQGDHAAAMKSFRSLYAEFTPANETTMRQMLAALIELAAAGAKRRDLLDVLLADAEKSAALAPFVAALRMDVGEPVRAPAEVIDVARDVIEEIEQRTTG